MREALGDYSLFLLFFPSLNLSARGWRVASLPHSIRRIVVCSDLRKGRQSQADKERS